MKKITFVLVIMLAFIWQSHAQGPIRDIVVADACESSTPAFGGSEWFYDGLEEVQGIVWVQVELIADCEDVTVDTLGSLFDTEIALYNSSGDLIGSNDDFGGGLQSSFTATGLAQGTYYVAAGGFDAIFNPAFGASSNSTAEADLFINITTGAVPLSCTPVIFVSTSVADDCAAGTFNVFVELDLETLGNLVDITLDEAGTITAPILGLNNITVEFGPFTAGTPINLYAINIDPACNELIGTFSDLCPKPQDFCDTAESIVPGIYTTTISQNTGSTVMGVGDDSAFFSYTPSEDGSIYVNSCFNGGDADTNLNIGIGPCIDLTPIASNDDSCDRGDGQQWASEITIPVTAGTTYIIEWDDRYVSGQNEFTWTLEFIPAPDPCNALISNTTLVSALCDPLNTNNLLLTVSFDITDGSGSYELVDVATNSTIGTLSAVETGTGLNIVGTIPKPTTSGTTIDVKVADTGILSTTELAINGDFETGDFSGWSQFANGATQSIISSNPSEGDFAANLFNTVLFTANVLKNANIGVGIVNPGDEITISFDARGNTAIGGVAFAELFSEIDGGGVSSAEILGGAPVLLHPDPNVWSSSSYTTIAGPDVSAGVTFQISAITGGAPGSLSNIFFDNLSITVQGEPIECMGDPIEIALPYTEVTFTGPGDQEVNSGLLTNLGGGLPVGGVYAGTGVTDDGNGLTYSFDTAFLDGGPVTITYTFTETNGCSSSASDEVGLLQPPPVNDESAGAIDLPVGDGVCETPLLGTNEFATDSIENDEDAGTCSSSDPEGDVWYKVTVPASGQLTIETSVTDPSSITDTVMSVYRGTPGNLVLIECDDDDAAGLFSQVQLSDADGIAPGDVLYVRVWEWQNNFKGVFNICAWDESALGVEDNTLTEFSYFPNPVKNTLTLNAQDTIADVTMYNMLGQVVLRATPNAVTSEIDMSALANGAYFVQVTIANKTQTVRVIKQ
jgi:hypothetical protein